AKLLAARHFHMVILDESQTIKNFTAPQTHSVHMLNADKRFALSGTPIENNLSELYSLFRFLNPAMFGSMDRFNREYVLPIARDKDSGALESLRRKIFPFMLRRLKKDVLHDLPARIDQTLYVEMTPEHAQFYEDRRKYYLEKVRDSIAVDGARGSQFVMFQALSELRRIASVPDSLTDGQIQSPKIELLAERIESAVDNGYKAVVFFNFIAGLEILARRLEETGIHCLTMTGATHDRRSIINTFQNNPECRVLIMTLKTGGVGLNLTAADTVFIAEPWWNKAAEEQAINRLHRIGQKSTVFCFATIVKNTIEEKIRELQLIKSDLFNDVIGCDEASSKNLTEEDINFILS
ncbi:MAG: DEAD/DEAH box helicase, partial [Muribaculaceae bacterium]|nr:DEAD/DEAH box helicase [Muribaculaceae bacterium]